MSVAVNPLPLNQKLVGHFPISKQYEARRSFPAFREIIGTDDKGKPIVLDALSRATCAMLQACYERREHIVIATPPGLAKSENVRSLVAWAMGKNHDIRVVYTSRDLGKITKDNVIATRRMISKRRYNLIFPNVKPDKRQERIASGDDGDEAGEFSQYQFSILDKNTHDPTVAAVAFETQAANRRVDIGIFDDIETEMSSRSLEMRTKTRTSLEKIWINGRLKGTNGFAIILSNCWHEDDLIHNLANTGFVSFWAAVNEEKTAMTIQVHNAPEWCPIRANYADYGLERISEDVYSAPFPHWNPDYNYRSLMDSERKTPDSYRSVFEFKPRSDKDRMFPTWPSRLKHDGDVAQAHKLSTPLRNGLPVFNKADQGMYAFAWGLDFSGSKRKGNVLSCFSIDRQRIIRPVEWHFFDVINSDIFIDVVEDARMRGINPSTVRVEDASLQDQLIGEYRVVAQRRRVPWMNLIENHKTEGFKFSEEYGLPMVEALIRNHEMEWPDAMREDRSVGQNWQMAESQIMITPRFPKRGETPDAPMSMWFAVKGLKDRGHIMQNSHSSPMIYSIKRKNRYDG